MIVDAYSHTGLPRFQTVANYRDIMRREGIGKAVLSSFDSSPDLAGIHAAFSEQPEIFRGLGVPLGKDHAEIAAGARAQLAAGFTGLRLTARDVLERPFLLDIVGEAGGVVLAVGRLAEAAFAEALHDALRRHEGLAVIGGHFAGGGEPHELEQDAVARLFAHPRFAVVFSRHGGYPTSSIRLWARSIVARAGWSRILWGAEAPLLFWRNETMPAAMAWIDFLEPTAEERAAFFGGNAERIYFARPHRPAPLALPFDPWTYINEVPAGLWANGLPVPQELAGRLVQDWLATGGEGTLGGHLETVLQRALPKLPKSSG
ncbi:MAG TPA: amidohydrolase family protein [Kaistia sp.]|nr:amidohydrolase family protein [Kaistia sp.]